MENLSDMKAQLMESFSNSIPKNFEERLAKIEEHQIQDSLKRSEDFQKILERIEAFEKDVQSKMENQKESLKHTDDFQKILERIEAFQKEVQSKIKIQQSAPTYAFTGVGRKLIREKFEQIGSRLFHISETPGDWSQAVETCRGLGGYIAYIKDQDELTALAERLDDKHYWLGINDLVSKGTYVSEASGKKPKFFKWRSGEPNNVGGVERCVELLNGGMNDVPCFSYIYDKYAICQADNEI